MIKDASIPDEYIQKQITGAEFLQEMSMFDLERAKKEGCVYNHCGHYYPARILSDNFRDSRWCIVFAKQLWIDEGSHTEAIGFASFDGVSKDGGKLENKPQTIEVLIYVDDVGASI